MPADVGRLLMVMGVVLLLVGLLITFGGKLPFQLPGDFVFKQGNVTVYLPLGTSLLLSLLLSLAMALFRR